MNQIRARSERGRFDKNEQELFACLQAISKPVKPLNRPKDPSSGDSRVNDADSLTPSFTSGRCRSEASALEKIPALKKP
jgi:hypothetical protein